VKLADITREHAWALLAEKVQGGMERTTALRIVALLREIMNHAVEDRLIPFTSGHGGPLRPSGSGRQPEGR